MLVFILLTLGVLSRLLVHVPNFTPVVALALFGGAYLKQRRLALLLPLGLMMISDLFLGFHQAILFTWGGVALAALVGVWLRGRRNGINLAAGSLFSALVFFVVSNFGAWLAMYPHTADGLARCYLAAIPFFRATVASTLIYTAVLCAGYEAVARAVRDTRLARVLLPAG